MSKKEIKLNMDKVIDLAESIEQNFKESGKAKEYNRKKIILSLVELGFLLNLVLIIIAGNHIMLPIY